MMRATYRSAIAVTIALGLCFVGRPASAADKNDRKCIDAAAKAIQKYAATELKELYKCREKPGNPATAQCDASLPKIVKAATKRDKTISKKCKGLDPVRAVGYSGCPVPGCKSEDATAAGYQACIACASGQADARMNATVSAGACGNGFVDAGEECDGTSDPRCNSQCKIASVCGNGMLEPREECDASVAGNACPTDGDQCVPAGLEKECTCVPPCSLDPVPARMAFSSNAASGDNCGCTLTDPNDTSCAGASKVADLKCGKLLVGGGLSAVPPGPTPDGSTVYTQFPICGGDELIIGPDDGEGATANERSKNCSKGFDEFNNPRCFFGPAIGVENNNASLSACVINGLKEDLRGTVNATTGASTMTAELESQTFLTGDLIFGRCRGGLTPGKPCQRGGVQPRGDCGVCAGGANDGLACQSDTVGTCAGGTNAFQTCANDGDCPGGSCDGNCPGGACQGICADDATGECVGGASAGDACKVGVCATGSSLGLPCTADGDCGDACVGGTKAGDDCDDNSDCPGGACTDVGTCGAGICLGGASQGDFCTMDGDCPASTCSTTTCGGGGTCTALGKAPVQACPVCVDAKFNPITDGSSGTCDLGERQGMSCSSENSEGLTIDCPPSEDLFLANLPVTLANLTTGQATMVADDDGTFCNFGFCSGGTQAGEPCNNGADCGTGGTCQKTCRGGLDANGNDLTGTPCANDDQCAGLTQGTCGQADPGAFIAGEAGGANVRRIIQNGQVAPGGVHVGDVKDAKIAAVFCIPETPKKEINNAGSLPGPGATALEGTFMVFGKCQGGANADAFCLDDSECPGGTCG